MNGGLERSEHMSHTTNFLAVDLGASSGRVMLGQWDGRILSKIPV